MHIPRSFVTVVGLITLAFIARAGEPMPPELTPRILTLKNGAANLSEILAELEKQTGNAIADRRITRRDDPKLTLRPATFWQTLDSIGVQTGIAFTPHGGVALVDTPYRKLATCYSGVFRFAVKSIAVARDDELQTHKAHVNVTVTWEPRFAPMYMNLRSAEATVGKKSEKLVGGGSEPLFGAGDAKFELTPQAPARTVKEIDLLKGEIHLIGAPKMLEFNFPQLGPVSSTKPIEADAQEGVKVRVTEVKQLSGRWVVRMQLAYPPGSIAGLESNQQPYWTNNNRIWLAWTDMPSKQRYTLEPTGDEYQDSKTGRNFVYTFTPQGDVPLPAKNAVVTLRYRTPNRVTAFTVPFEFQNLQLP